MLTNLVRSDPVEPAVSLERYGPWPVCVNRVFLTLAQQREAIFLKVLDEKTIGFADFAGNRQYVTLGNLADNPKAYLFLIDYAHRRRIKIWGEARIVEGDAELTAKLMPEGYKARPEQVILFTIFAWDANCPQHIPQRLEAADVAAALAARDKRIEALEAEINRLRETVASSATATHSIFDGAS